MSPVLVEGLLSLLVTGVVLASLVGGAAESRLSPAGALRFRTADGFALVLLLLGALSLAWRRRAPLAVLVVSGTAFVLYEGLGYAPPPLPFALLVSLYTVAAWCPLPASATATGAILIAVAAAAVTHRGPLTPDQVLAYLLSVVAAWLLGYGVQLTRARLSLLEDRAVRLVREQADKTQLAVEQERVRIAREVHDIIAHSVGVIVAQAAAAQRLFDAEPQQARQTLGAIETTGRQAVVELRRLLGVLQADQGQAERAPQPGLDRLPALVEQVGRAGLPVELVVHGSPRPLPAEVELSAYRIVQEALTNTLKHAGPTRAGVVLGYHPGMLELRVWDEGRGSTPGVVPGQGLVGMRQRAALLGGEVAARPGPEGGFQVTARLPSG
jgi:signal transduction histidine kinase